MLVRVETSRVGPAQLPSAASWRVSSSFAYRILWRSGRPGGVGAQVVEDSEQILGVGASPLTGQSGPPAEKRKDTGLAGYAELGIMQSIFSPASRRDTPPGE